MNLKILIQITIFMIISPFCSAETLNVAHSFWRDSLTVLPNNRIKRSSNQDEGSIVFNRPESFTIKWDKYGTETFELTNMPLYILNTIPNNNFLEKEITSKYHELEYSFQTPFILINPYKLNPLSAIIKFPTSKPAQIKTILKGKNDASDITQFHSSYSKEHTIPIYGLYQNMKNIVEVTAIYNDKSEEKTTVVIPIGNTHVNTHIFQAFTTQKKEDDYYFLTNGQIYDSHGELRYAFNTLLQSYFFPNEIILESRINGLARYTHIGKFLQAYPYPTGFTSFTHGLGRMPNGNFLVIGTMKGSKALINGKWEPTNHDIIIELDYKTGKHIKTWDLGNILNPNRSVIVKSTTKDWGSIDFAHTNSVVYDQKDNTLLISARHTGLLKISYKNGELVWIMGPNKEYDQSKRNGKGASIAEKVLQAVTHENKAYSHDVQMNGSEQFAWPIYTHDGRIVSENIYSVFDNSHIPYDTKIYAPRQSGARIYQVDEKKKTIKLLWSQNYPYQLSYGGSAEYNPKKKTVVIYFAKGRLYHVDYYTREILFEAIINQPSPWIYSIKTVDLSD